MLIKKFATPKDKGKLDEILTKVPRTKINNVNWPDDFPAKPYVDFQIFHDGENIYLRYSVEEKYTMARVDKDFGEVWTDSCVEFFVKFDDKGYYNLEFNSIGKGLLSFRQSRDNAENAPSDIMNSIERVSSLGTKPFEERENMKWELMLKIPKKAFFAHDLPTLSGVKAKANFYKCGDNLSEPHYISWNKIDVPTPNFHLPEYFGEITFE